MGNSNPHTAADINACTDKIALHAPQMSLCALAIGAPACARSMIQHMKQDDLAIERLGETDRQRQDLQRAPVQVDRQQ
jgi:hypothetical protein